VAGETSFLFPPESFSPGPILDQTGKQLGVHKGLPRYTIGQRRGLGIAAEQPMFVIDIDPERNALVVGPDKALLRTGLVAYEASYLSGQEPKDGTSLLVKVRYRSPAVPATFHTSSNSRFQVTFDEPQRAITPGQLAVLYDGEQLLGGGTIEHSTAAIS